MRNTFFLVKLFLLFFALNSFLSFKTYADDSTINKISSSFGTFKYEIHFSDGYEQLAHETNKIVLEFVPKMIDYFKYVPKDTTHLIINEEAKAANGVARGIPTNIIELYDFPPLDHGSLTLPGHWQEILTVHELFHIFHLDQTRGFNKVVRTIFGSIGKLGFITPRWFTEGVAVWGEGHFTGQGRTQNHQIRNIVSTLMQSDEFCRTLDCLDTPGVYPMGHTPYWVGGMFMEYLEQQKPGTIKCLIEENSEAPLFFLDSTFYNCTSKYPKALFSEFRQSFTNTPALINVNWTVKFQTYKDKLFYSKYENQDEYLVEFDLNSKTTIKKHALKGSILDLYVANDKLFVKTQEYSAVKAERTYYQFTGKKFKRVKIPSTPYAFPVKDKWVSFDYDDFIWSINEEYMLKRGEALKTPEITSEGVYFLSYENNDNSKIWKYNGNDLIFANIDKNYEFIGHCQSNLYLNHGKSTYVFNSKDNSVSRLDNYITQISSDQSIIVLYESGNYKKQNECPRGKREMTLTFQNYQNSEEDKVSIAQSSISNYPRFKHFLPKYWLLFYSNSDNLSNVNASTELTDPKLEYSLSLKLNAYTEVSEYRPEVQFMYDNKHFYIGIGHIQRLAKRSGTATLYDQELSYAFLGKRWFSSDWNFSLGAQVSYSNDQDVFSRRDVTQYDLPISLTYTPSRLDSFFRTTSLKLTPGYRVAESKSLSTKKTDDFVFEGSFDTKLRLSRRNDLLLSASYGKLFSDDLLSGPLYGGGDLSSYPIIGVAYSDVYGTEISQYRGQYQFLLAEIYRGISTKPFFLKDIKFILGADSVKSDVAIIDNTFIFDKTIHSYYGGAKFRTKIGFLLDLNIDIFLYSVEAKQTENNGLYIGFSSELF